MSDIELSSFLGEKVSELKKCYPSLTKKADFDSFWDKAIDEVFQEDHSNYEFILEEVNFPIKKLKVFKATLIAIDGAPLHGWYLVPEGLEGEQRVPGLVRFHGYSSNKGNISELLSWALQGYAILSMDIRGQCGDTPDPRRYSTGSFAGWLTQGLNSPQEYYYRQVYLDGVHLIEALSRRKEVDSSRIGLFGNSQGGGIAIAAAALMLNFKSRIPKMTTTIQAVSAGIPFLADIRRSYREHSEGPWQEFDWYFKMHDPLHQNETAIFECLSYFDVMNFAPWVTCPTQLSVGLQDTICTPPTVFALYNHLGGRKEIIPYLEAGHEKVDHFVDQQIIFLAKEILNKE